MSTIRKVDVDLLYKYARDVESKILDADESLQKLRAYINELEEEPLDETVKNQYNKSMGDPLAFENVQNLMNSIYQR